MKKETKPDVWDTRPIPDDYARPQDEVPYERIMLHIIQDYRRLKLSIKKAGKIINKQRKELESLKSCKATREEYVHLQHVLAKKNEKIKSLSERKKNQIIEQLRLEIQEKDRMIRELKGK